MFTAQFWKEVFERAVKTFFQTLIATGIIASAAGATSQQWKDAGFVIGIATILSVASSVAGVAIGPKGSASLVEPVTEAPVGTTGFPVGSDDIVVLSAPDPEPTEQNLEDRQEISDYLAGGK